MKRLVIALMGTVVLAIGAAHMAVGAELKPIHVQKTKDLVVTLASNSGQWKPGKNDFVLEFTSAKDSQPVEAGKVSLNTSMTMTGMAPMIVGATLSPDKTPGRYAGTVTFPDRGARQVTVTWDGPAGKGSTKFSVSVR